MKPAAKPADQKRKRAQQKARKARLRRLQLGTGGSEDDDDDELDDPDKVHFSIIIKGLAVEDYEDGAVSSPDLKTLIQGFTADARIESMVAKLLSEGAPKNSAGQPEVQFWALPLEDKRPQPGQPQEYTHNAQGKVVTIRIQDFGDDDDIDSEPLEGEGALPESEDPGAAKKSREDEVVDQSLRDDSMLDWWKKTSGLHTVQKWLSNYTKHPAGWGALLMIHGIPEVTGRLRAKVESYAMYSALFLSVTIGIMVTPPSSVAVCPEDLDTLPMVWCELRKRLFFYSIAGGLVLHVLCIGLAMAFVNALNEAARDSDVIRMFARGQGFKATVKVQNAFRCGVALNWIAISMSAQSVLGWEIVIVFLVMSCGALKVYMDTKNLLFNNASIVKYWRRELGGNPDEDDPYDLQIPVERAQERAEIGRDFIKLFSSKQEGLPKHGEPPPKAPGVEL